MLAPCIGNIHGRYMKPAAFHLDLLEKLQSTIGPSTKSNAYLVLHGTDHLPDSLFTNCVQRGAYKINLNSCAHDAQVQYWANHLVNDPLSQVYQHGMQEVQIVCKRFFDLLGSASNA